MALAAGLVIADVAIVTLALPQLLVELHTSVEGVAAVLITYTLVLGLALASIASGAAPLDARRLGGGGFLLFALGAVVCAAAGTLPVLLVGRAVQGLGGAGALAGAFELLDGRGRGRTSWLLVSVLAGAAGPALGGALTQGFGWRAIFIVQIPIALLAARGSLSERSPTTLGPERVPRASPLRHSWRYRLALVLLSAALSAVLFLLVLLLIAGWGVSPLRAAAAVSVLPLMVAAGSYLKGDPIGRAALGCLLVAGGLGALAWLPEPNLLWTIPPDALAGLGMGLGLRALGVDLLPERSSAQAAGLLSLRHLGIALVLAALAPLIAGRLTSSTHQAKLQGIGIVLDAQLSPRKKLELAPELLGSVSASDPRASLQAGLSSQRSRFQGAEAVAFRELAVTADATLLRALADALRDAFLIAGGLALIAAGLILWRRAPTPMLISAALLACASTLAYFAAHAALAPAPVALTDGCSAHPSSNAGGLEGFVETQALALLDRDACRLHISREELVLVSADAKEGERFARSHGGVRPGSLENVLEALL